MRKWLTLILAVILVFLPVMAQGQEDAYISGVVREVNGEPLAGALVAIDDEFVTITDSNGQYSIQVNSGYYSITVYKAEYRGGMLRVNADGNTTCNFEGDTGIIPDAPDMQYALDCINLWLYPPEGAGISMATVCSVICAWLYPV